MEKGKRHSTPRFVLQYASHLYRSTPPICSGDTFEKMPGGGGCGKFLNNWTFFQGMRLFCLQLEASCLQWSSSYLQLTSDKFSSFAYNWSFFAYSFSFFTCSWSFFAYSGKVRLIGALRDCKPKKLNCKQKKTPTACKTKLPPKLGDLSPWEQNVHVTRDDGTVTLYTLSAATVLSHNSRADFARPLAKKVMSHLRDSPDVTVPLPKTKIIRCISLTGVQWEPILEKGMRQSTFRRNEKGFSVIRGGIQ